MKGQIELWLLTKIGMLFFIISLSLIAINISNIEKSALCGEQALATARIITSNVNQVLAAPVEDARVVYKFEPTIPISKEKYGERYEVWLKERTLNDNKVQLSVQVNPLSDESCKRSVSLYYDPEKVETHFYSGAAETISETIHGEEIVKITPSEFIDLSKKTKYLVLVKCSEKTFRGKIHVYFDDCKNDDAGACSSFEPTPAEYLEGCV